MSERELVERAIASLSGSCHPIRHASAITPRRPGLYAICGKAAKWQALGLGRPPDDRPLYVGKSELSLWDRDIRTHFGNGRTGSSTVRRTFGALLRDALDLHATPRNPAKPERLANFGLSTEDDEKLTGWMRNNLWLAVWPSPPATMLSLVEGTLLGRLQPPLNLQGVSTRWSPTVAAARAVMRREASGWARARGFPV